MNLLELPLILMDTTLWGYLKKSEEEGFGDAVRMMKAVEEVEGLFTLLWHQEAVRMRGGRIYWQPPRRDQGGGASSGAGRRYPRWWRARSRPAREKG